MIKRYLLSLVLILGTSLPGFCQNGGEKSIDEIIDDWVSPASTLISEIVFFPLFSVGDMEVPFIVIWLMGGAIIFTFYLKFINIRGFKHSINIVKGKYSSPDDPGEVTHFQALSAALSATVGLGNIAGVAIAISIGGPGAVFWMVIAGLFSMTAKFVECTLGVKFRNVHADGTVSGGPMYYLSKGLAEKGYGRFGLFLASFFALMCIGGSFGGGNMFQVNQAAQQFIEVTGGENTFIGQNTWIFGTIMAMIVALVIIGGIKSIVKVTEKIVPFMTVYYLFACLVVLAYNFYQIPEAVEAMVEGALYGNAVGGGLIGTLIIGIRRAAFSNEAGIGSAPIAHSAVKTKEPVTEGFVASLEPFVDTVIVCTMTSLVIVISGVYKTGGADVEGIQLTSSAFATVIDWFPTTLSIAVILFAFSTMISWSYYGLKAWTYLFGRNNLADLSYKVLFCGFIIIGSSVTLTSVNDFSVAMIFAMAFPNILGLFILAPQVRKEMNSFLDKIKKNKI